MKNLNTHINERFKENSDPVHDLGIGIMPQIKKLLIDNNYELVDRDMIWICAKYQKINFVKYLIEKGGKFIYNIDYALLKAVYNNDLEMVNILLNAGANPEGENKESLKVANNKKYVEILKILKKYIRKIHKTNEGYGAGFSMSSGGHFSGGMGGTSRGGFGGSSNMGGPNMMYTYEIKPLNHTLEQLPTVANDQLEQIQIGSRVSGNPIKTNANPQKKEVKGIVHKIVTTDDGALKYYIIQDEATQKLVKLEPLSVKLIISDPVEYYYDTSDTIPTRKRGKKIRENLVSESLDQFLNEELSGSEALYGFAGWLTTKDEETIMSAHHDSGKIAELVDKFNKKQNLKKPRKNWEKELIPMNKK